MNNEIQQVVYAGKRLYGTKFQYAYLINLATDPKLVYISRLLEKHARPGTLIEVTIRVDDDGATFFAGTPKVIGEYTDTQAVAGWKIEDRAAQVEYDLMKSIAANNKIVATLEPVRKLYQNSTPRKRVALLADIISYITRR